MGTANEAVGSPTGEPPRSIMIVVEPSSPHDDCVSLNVGESLSDVGSGPAVGG